jgi:hypothetical protein
MTTTKTFLSDFEMIPVSKINTNGWVFKSATWPSHIDPLVHKLLEKKSNVPITYIRKRWRDNVVQNCTIYMENDTLFMNPGDNCIYKINKKSIHNREPDDTIVDNSVPHELKCLVCLCNKRTHIVPDCNHVVACANCAIGIMTYGSKKCPLCNVPIKNNLEKIYF